MANTQAQAALQILAPLQHSVLNGTVGAQRFQNDIIAALILVAEGVNGTTPSVQNLGPQYSETPNQTLPVSTKGH